MCLRFSYYTFGLDSPHSDAAAAVAAAKQENLLPIDIVAVAAAASVLSLLSKPINLPLQWRANSERFWPHSLETIVASGSILSRAEQTRRYSARLPASQQASRKN